MATRDAIRLTFAPMARSRWRWRIAGNAARGEEATSVTSIELFGQIGVPCLVGQNHQPSTDLLIAGSVDPRASVKVKEHRA